MLVDHEFLNYFVSSPRFNRPQPPPTASGGDIKCRPLNNTGCLRATAIALPPASICT